MSNSLAAVHPELIVEWSDKKYYNYLADERNLKVSTIDSIHTVLHQILQIISHLRYHVRRRRP